MKKDKKVIFAILLVFIFFITVGTTYAIFSFREYGNEDANNTIVTTTSLRLVYNDSSHIQMSDIHPGTGATKTFSVTNLGENTVLYNIFWKDLFNSVIYNEITYTLTCQRYTNYGEPTQAISGTCEGQSLTPVGTRSEDIKNNISIETSITHVYTMNITFEEKSSLQNYNQGKAFRASINVREAGEIVETETFAQVAAIGNYISYDAGNFTATDPDITPNNFGGKVASRSRNVGINCATSAYYQSDANHQGWRILDITNGVVKIVHAGTPECFKTNGQGATHVSTMTSRDWSEYLNPVLGRSVSLLDQAMIEAYPNEAALTVESSLVNDNELSVLLAGGRYFIPNVNPLNTQQLIEVGETGWVTGTGWDTRGVRPVVTLKSNLYVASGSGSVGDPYVLTDIPPVEAEPEKVNQNGYLTGYWENWKNNDGANVKLAGVPMSYNMVALGFGSTPEGAQSGTISFELDEYLSEELNYSVLDMKEDIVRMKSRGQKVILSVGGADNTVTVDGTGSVNNFVSSVISIIDSYGLNGIDINIENNISPVYLSQAILQLVEHYGDDFILVITPETVNIASNASGTISGTYYELIQEIKDHITIVNVQLYNTGGQFDIRGTYHESGNVNFDAMYVDVLSAAGLDDSQIGLGFFAKSGVEGYVTAQNAADVYSSALLGGTTKTGTYRFLNEHPRLGGMMIYSINEDLRHSYAMSNKFREILR